MRVCTVKQRKASGRFIAITKRWDGAAVQDSDCTGTLRRLLHRYGLLTLNVFRSRAAADQGETFNLPAGAAVCCWLVRLAELNLPTRMQKNATFFVLTNGGRERQPLVKWWNEYEPDQVESTIIVSGAHDPVQERVNVRRWPRAASHERLRPIPQWPT